MRRLIALSTITVIAAATHSIADDVRPPANLPSAVSDTDYYESGRTSADKVELGRLLFFDKILSGNKNIACGTCHFPDQGTSDGLALGLGEGPSGVGPNRKPGATKETAVHERVPRNSPALFNLGAREFVLMFHDGRVEIDPEGYYEGGFITPARWKLPAGLDNVLAAQAMFPVTSPTEMAGQQGENDIADARSLNNAAGPGGVWELLAHRLQAIPEYVARFKAAFPDQVEQAEDISYVMAANAIAAFESDAFRADDSPFDRYLRGSGDAMDRASQRGMALFYGKAECSTCHSGAFQTDHDFHAIAMPQIGPGKADGRHADYWNASGEKAFVEDFGRGRVTGRPDDNFKFRTPTLRNVALTGPWGHDGAYNDLEQVVRHHLDPERSLEQYDPSAAFLPELRQILETIATGSRLEHQWLPERRREGFTMRDTWVQRNEELRARIARANELQGVTLTDEEVADVLTFLRSLTDPSSRRLGHLVPGQVPSGLPVDN